MELDQMLGHNALQTLDEVASLITSVLALILMWRVGHQEWSSPFNMYARRLSFGLLSGIAFCHLASPAWLPEIAQQFSIAILLLVMIMGKSPRDARISGGRLARRSSS
jgi:hypothetical protein